MKPGSTRSRTSSTFSRPPRTVPTVCFCLGKLKDGQEVVFNERRLLVELHPRRRRAHPQRLDADPAGLRQARAAGRHGADGHRGDHRAGAVAAAAGVQGRRFRLAAHAQPPGFGQAAGAPVLPRRHRPLPRRTRRDLHGCPRRPRRLQAGADHLHRPALVRGRRRPGAGALRLRQGRQGARRDRAAAREGQRAAGVHGQAEEGQEGRRGKRQGRQGRDARCGGEGEGGDEGADFEQTLECIGDHGPAATVSMRRSTARSGSASGASADRLDEFDAKALEDTIADEDMGARAASREHIEQRLADLPGHIANLLDSVQAGGERARQGLPRPARRRPPGADGRHGVGGDRRADRELLRDGRRQGDRCAASGVREAGHLHGAAADADGAKHFDRSAVSLRRSPNRRSNQFLPGARPRGARAAATCGATCRR